MEPPSVKQTLNQKVKGEVTALRAENRLIALEKALRQDLDGVKQVRLQNGGARWNHENR